jgi:hypothetical protein
LDLADHEARLGPFDHAGTLADPDQAYGKCKKACDQEPIAHGFALSAVVDPAWNDAARVARSFTAGKGQQGAQGLSRKGQQPRSFAKGAKKPRTMPGLLS